MDYDNLLFDSEGDAIAPDTIYEKIAGFGHGYNKAVQDIIRGSRELDDSGEVFIRCTVRLLSNFKMTRSGPFKGMDAGENGNGPGREVLDRCWEKIGKQLLEIKRSIPKSGFSRDRYLLELAEPEREELTKEIWSMTKKLLPLTIGRTSYGLVGASKILFAVLPEIVLPIDNSQWLNVFKTVDLGDVINRMAVEIREWESATGKKLNEMDCSGKLTTLPSVYNVMAMDARPRTA